MTGLGSSCGACKFLRRKCTSDCVFAPYFCYDQASTHFAAVHKVFGASNVSKLLLHLPVHTRSDAAITISYEALARMRDPIYGCVAHIFALQEQVANLQEEIEILGTQMANLGVGVPSWRNSPVPGNPSNFGPQFSGSDAMNVQFYLNHQQDPLLPQAEAATTTNLQALESSMNEEFPPIYGWEDQNPFCDNYPNLLERHFEGVDREAFSSCSWLNGGNGLGK